MSIDSKQIFSGFPKGLFYDFSEGFTKKGIVVHGIILLLLLVLGRWGLIIWFYGLIIYGANFVLKANNRGIIPAFLLYIIPLEILGRITSASPFVPYESGKYTLFAVLIFLLATLKIKKGFWGFLIIVLCLPGTLLIEEADTFKSIVFNLLGIINMALGAIVFSNFAISSEQLRRTISIAIWPLLVLTCYLIIKTPSLDGVDFQLGANQMVTGGFGSNQVATILGLGLLLFGFQYLFDWRFSHSKYIDGALAGMMLLWGLLSFSRGGIIGAILSILAINILVRKKKGYLSPKSMNFSFLLPVAIVLIGIFLFANSITNGALLHRYQGDTQATLIGAKDKSLNGLTSGRFDLVVRDWDIWMNNFMIGVGVGNASIVGERDYDNNLMPHVEFSRLIAEHGLFGLIVVFILTFIPISKVLIEKIPLKKSWFLMFIVLSLFTTFHSATRTLITPVLFGLAFLNIYDEKALMLKQEQTTSE